MLQICPNDLVPKPGLIEVGEMFQIGQRSSKYIGDYTDHTLAKLDGVGTDQGYIIVVCVAVHTLLARHHVIHRNRVVHVTVPVPTAPHVVYDKVDGVGIASWVVSGYVAKSDLLSHMSLQDYSSDI